MYIINKEANRIVKIDNTTFKQLGFKERENLQEWIANNPACLDEDLLIIQKEFDGFNDTNERLDLLALDKQGNLVIIENKLDDTGRDVTWQVIKYSSYCSTLNSSQIASIFGQYLSKHGIDENPETLICEFLETEDYKERLNLGNTQRIILIAGEFRKEVTSSVLWLLNFGLRIQCFKATPYKLEEKLFMNLEQIIPIRGAEDFVISMANKSREEVESQEINKERHSIRINFWKQYLKEINKVTSLYQNVNTSKDNWIGAGSGISSVGFHSVVSRNYIRIELYINTGDKANNKFIFDTLASAKEKIEEDFGEPLTWERLDNKVVARIKSELTNVSLFNQDDWAKMISFMVDVVPRFEHALKPHVQKINKKKITV